MIYNATIQWKDNGNIEDNKLIVVGVPEELIMGTYMDDDIFFYCEDSCEFVSKIGGKNNESEEWHILSSRLDEEQTTRLMMMVTRKETKQITISVMGYHPEDENGNVDESKMVYDFEEMANEFEQKLSELDDTAVVMCSIETK